MVKTNEAKDDDDDDDDDEPTTSKRDKGGDKAQISRPSCQT